MNCFFSFRLKPKHLFPVGKKGFQPKRSRFGPDMGRPKTKTFECASSPDRMCLCETAYLHTSLDYCSGGRNSPRNTAGVRVERAASPGFAHKVWNEGGQSSSKDDLANRPVLTELLSQIQERWNTYTFGIPTDWVETSTLGAWYASIWFPTKSLPPTGEQYSQTQQQT